MDGHCLWMLMGFPWSVAPGGAFLLWVPWSPGSPGIPCSVGETVQFSIYGPGSCFESVLGLESHSARKIMPNHGVKS